MDAVFRARRELPVAPRVAFHWHTLRGAFERLSPPWQKVRLLVAPDALADGTQAVLELRALGVRRQWVAEHREVRPGQGFTDVQLIGPFAAWTHHHRFLGREDPDTSILEDEVRYELPGGFPGRALGGDFARRALAQVFAYRHAVTAADATRFWREDFPRVGTILVTGHTGLVGSALCALLRSLGYTVRGLTRSPRTSDDFAWDPAGGTLDEAALEGVDAVVHLAGAGVADHRWTPSYRKAILESRRESTRILTEAMARQGRPPRVLVSASGANWYPLDGEAYDESGPRGEGFLSEVCEVWESAADPARAVGVRVVHPRIAAVLTPAGGALAKMLPAFRAGLGGPLGGGRQRFSWIGLHDLLDIIVRAIEDERMEGPVNAVAPEVPAQREFAAVLGRVLGRPAVLPGPAFAIRAAFGRDLADETVLADLHVVPGRLRELGYVWRHAGLEGALRYYLGRVRLDV
jgi:uncharacterized protein